MASTTSRIDQAGRPAGTPGVARTDGLDTGAQVTVTIITPGAVNAVRVLWKPSADAASVVVDFGGGVFKFSPSPKVYGTWIIQIEVDGDTDEMVFGVRTPRLGILIPAFNEIADPNASLYLNGPDQVDASQNNEPYAANPAINYAGWWPAMENAMLKIDAIGRVNAVITFGDSPYTAVPGEYVEVDTSGGDVTVLLPTTAGDGEDVQVKHLVSGNRLTLDGQGIDIDGVPTVDTIIPDEHFRVVRGNTQWDLS